MTTAYWCETAWLDPDRGVAAAVSVDVEGGRFTGVTVGADPGGSATRLPGLVLPGLANCHSHAFHRALRGHTQAGRGTFWTWREQMYATAARLDPDSYHRLALATYTEMVLAGITSVGEFHYLHHGPDGVAYDDPNAMGHALVAAAREAGVRITLLDTCYLAAGFGRPPEGVQLRFSDGDAARWADRAEALHQEYAGDSDVVVAAAIHSVRAVPDHQLATVAQWASAHEVPLHVHLSEQPAENADCLEAHGQTPTELLEAHGVLGPRTSAVHATHLTGSDVHALGTSRTYACFCPTTERDLADGVGPARALTAAGAPLTLGSDSHAVIDPFEEMRAVELDERLTSRHRGTWSAEELLVAGGPTGQSSLGWTDGGRIEVGARADLVAVRTDSPRTAGTGGEVATAVFAASGCDVADVVVDGRHVVAASTHASVGDVGVRLRDAVAAVRSDET
ncbi:MAG: formimidoylglutamate deiminase [Nocardioidaceae bacterium]